MKMDFIISRNGDDLYPVEVKYVQQGQDEEIYEGSFKNRHDALVHIANCMIRHEITARIWERT